MLIHLLQYSCYWCAYIGSPLIFKIFASSAPYEFHQGCYKFISAISASIFHCFLLVALRLSMYKYYCTLPMSSSVHSNLPLSVTAYPSLLYICHDEIRNYQLSTSSSSWQVSHILEILLSIFPRYIHKMATVMFTHN